MSSSCLPPVARAHFFYGPAFEPKDKDELARSIRDFVELSDAEQRFAVAHLLYLNLQAQATGARLLREQRDTLDEVADAVADGLEALADEGDDEPGAPDEAAPTQPAPASA